MNLLIVDDEALAVQGVLDSVSWDRLGFEKILTAYSSAQAKKVLEQEKVRILICDIEMRGGSGLDLVEWIRQQGLNPKCIFLTCHDEFSYAKRAISLDCCEYVLKPVLGEEMTNLLLKVKHEAEQEDQEQYYMRYGQKYLDFISAKDNRTMEEQGGNALRSTENYILGHLSEILNPQDLAQKVYLEPEDLERLFQEKYDKSLSEFIVDQRMFLAKKLLEKNEYSVSMISAKVGYSNYLYFTRLFQERFGMSPREYQRKFKR